MGEENKDRRSDLEKTEKLLLLSRQRSKERNEKPADPEVALADALEHLINNIVGDDLNALAEGRLSVEDIEKDREEIINSLNREYPDGLPEVAQRIVDILRNEWTKDNLQSVIDLVESFAKGLGQKDNRHV